MKIGTRSVLYGVHAFWLHPWFVAAAWWRLYGFPWDPRLWVAFFVHDIGYFGRPNMDGEEGERHPEVGAGIMLRWFDKESITGRLLDLLFGDRGGMYWHNLVLYHSRFLARLNNAHFSRLCVADKLAITLTPAWLYLPMARATGELWEYMEKAEQKEGNKYASMALHDSDPRQWYENVRAYLRRWVERHRDGREDTWTPDLQAERSDG